MSDGAIYIDALIFGVLAGFVAFALLEPYGWPVQMAGTVLATATVARWHMRGWDA